MSAARPIAVVVLITAVAWPAAALAHGGAMHDTSLTWQPEPLVAILLAVALWLYLRGVWRLWSRATVGHGVRRWEAASFVAGWLVLALALLSPIHALGEILFWVHMIEHILLMTVAAPLLVLGRPLVAFLWALSPGARHALAGIGNAPPVRRAWLFLTGALTAWCLHGLTLWLWHAPVLFDAALRSETVHAFQHLCFLAAALLYWSALLLRRPGAERRGVAVLSLFATSLHSGLLGALLTLAGAPWYAGNVAALASWNLTPLEDQQLAGLMMWVPAGLAYIGAALALLAVWLRDSEMRARRWEAALGKSGD